MEGLRKIVLADLARGIRLMIEVQDELDPQFRFATPEGDFALALLLPDDKVGRKWMYERLRRFCAFKQVIAFTMTANIEEPEALVTLGVGMDGVLCCMSVIEGEKGYYDENSFGRAMWLPREAVGEDIMAVLPRGAMALSENDLVELEEWFGKDGKFPAVHLPSGEIGL